MKTISLKMPDDLFEKMEKYRAEENLNRSSYVMEAVMEYTKKIEREELRKKLEVEARITAEEYAGFKEEMKDWDATLMDGLEAEDWGNGKI